MATRSPAFSPRARNAKKSSSTRKRNSSVETWIHWPFVLNLNASGFEYWLAESKSKLGRVEMLVADNPLPSGSRIPTSSFNMGQQSLGARSAAYHLTRETPWRTINELHFMQSTRPWVHD